MQRALQLHYYHYYTNRCTQTGGQADLGPGASVAARWCLLALLLPTWLSRAGSRSAAHLAHSTGGQSGRFTDRHTDAAARELLRSSAISPNWAGRHVDLVGRLACRRYARLRIDDSSDVGTLACRRGLAGFACGDVGTLACRRGLAGFACSVDSRGNSLDLQVGERINCRECRHGRRHHEGTCNSKYQFS